jgi:coenzyme F420-reducing hydrogenase beta subunit
MIDKKINDNCCGCKMCGDICPKSAISFPTDKEGFWYPTVNYEMCISCGLCIEKCPALNEAMNKNAFTPPTTYAAYISNDEYRLKATSGGIFPALALTMLKEGGYIAGCSFSDDWKSACHVVGNTKEDLEKIIRSKYFQSDTSGIYKKIKRLLDAGERVLFSGTPCQNAALIQYLRKDYENLIQTDFICMGICSPKAHKLNIEELEKKHSSKLKYFQYKHKLFGWAEPKRPSGSKLTVYAEFTNGEKEICKRQVFFKGFVNQILYLRKSCENCRYRHEPRLTDITFGDFWGQIFDDESMAKGVSVVMVNTEKGSIFYNKTLPILHSEASVYKKAKSGNAFITNNPNVDHANRTEFFNRISAGESFSEVVLSIEHRNMWRKLPKKVASKVRKQLLKPLKIIVKKGMRQT